jgi:1-aminocyclopropane-1-carboxylate deaminase
MLAGLQLAKHRLAAQAEAGTRLPELMGLPVLKSEGLEEEISALLASAGVYEKVLLLRQFHGGGYAKTSPEQFAFMRSFYQETGVPSDMNYTSKLFQGIRQLIQQGAFPVGSRVLAIHSGGLQGNRSLKKGILPY